MNQTEPRAWWAEAQDLRERIERQRAAEPLNLPAAGEAPGDRAAGSAATPVRRTVQITGRPSGMPAPRPLVVARARSPRAAESFTRRPDRIAGWAALLGLVLVLVSAASH